MNRRKTLGRAAMFLAAAGTAGAQSTESWSPKKASVGGPIWSGHLLFLSGIGGWYPERRPKPGDVREQTGDALEMMKTALEKAGTSMANVLKLQVALVDPEHNWAP